MRTTVLLDVDGVVAPLPAESPHWGDWVNIKKRARLPLHVELGFNCHLSRAMGDALADLDADFCWLTTWEDLANEVIAPFMGWDPLSVFHSANYFPPWKSERMEWKFAAAEDLQSVTCGAPLIWVDDDIGRPPQVPTLGPQRDWDLVSFDGTMFSVPRADFQYALVVPESSVGITPEQIEFMARKIEEWK